MIDLKGIFKNKQPDGGKLLKSGFSLSDGKYRKTFPILQGQFTMDVGIFADGTVDYHVYDAQTAEEYYLARVPDAAGVFVGGVHAACAEILQLIARNCCFTEHFRSGQTKRVLQYLKENFGADPEFLWKAYPDYAVFRVPAKKEWFALVAPVERRKFGRDEDGFVEVINLKNEPSAVAACIEAGRAYPAYHMNKKYWYSVFLDESLPDGEIFSLIDVSFRLISDPLPKKSR